MDTSTMEAQALAAADEIVEAYGGGQEKGRLRLAMAWLEGYGIGMAEGRRIAEDAIVRLHVELTS